MFFTHLFNSILTEVFGGKVMATSNEPSPEHVEKEFWGVIKATYKGDADLISLRTLRKLIAEKELNTPGFTWNGPVPYGDYRGQED